MIFVILLTINIFIMKKIREISQNPIVIALVLFNFIFVSCSRDNLNLPTANQDVSSKSVNYDGKEIFKSIVFADGALASKVTFVNDHFNMLKNLKSEKEIKAYKEYENEVVSYLEKQQPNFFNDFKTSMLSKDPNQIQKKLNETGNLLIPFLDSKIAYTGITVEKIRKDPKLLNELKTKYATNETGRTSTCLAVAIAVEGFVPGFVFAVLVAFVADNGVQVIGTESMKTEELAVSISNNL